MGEEESFFNSKNMIIGGIILTIVVTFVIGVIILILFMRTKKHKNPEHHATPPPTELNQELSRRVAEVEKKLQAPPAAAASSQCNNPNCPTHHPANYIPGKDFEFTKGSGAPAIVLFYSNGCPHCKKMMPAWDALVDILGKEENLDAIAISAADNMKEAQYNKIMGYPTIRFYPEGYPSDKFIVYSGDRSTESLLSFVQSEGQK